MTKIIVTALLISLTFIFKIHAAEAAGIFSDNMILQRNMPVPVWGKGKAGENIVVSFQKQKLQTKVDSDGRWMVKLKPLEASFDPSVLKVNSQEFKNVLIGEVWLASGQSNMAGSKKFDNFSDNKLIIRASQITKKIEASELLENGWSTSGSCSEVAYHFGCEIAKQVNVPVGLIVRAVSGSPIQTWIPKEIIEPYRKKSGIAENWNDDAPMHNSGDHFPSHLEPVIPYAIRGSIWYQGERNSKTGTHWHYREMQPLMIDTWRVLWAKKANEDIREFPFITVQVPCAGGSKYLSSWDIIRDSMRRVAVEDPNAGLAVFYDNSRVLHPQNKHIASFRLAQWALKHVYGKEDAIPCPLLTQHDIKDKKIILHFDYAGKGLKIGGESKKLDFFEICGEDGKYHPAIAVIEKNTVILSSDQVSKPTHARYLFGRSDAAVSLYNSADLPASSFITDPEFTGK